ncbi:hypothetical protein GQ44DRAFT_701858 [Phaeosphaeriaceae sp. PMI808]|nr:hypothetical protein GQ44DRAFT_701858 [Phaeosphaeriaceae sp. PMI808]
MALLPTILYPLTLFGLLQHFVTSQPGTTPTTLIVCSTRDAFLQQLALNLKQEQSRNTNTSVLHLVTPSLHNLSTTRHVKLAFCASVQTLLAYLTAYGRGNSPQSDGSKEKPRLVLVNLLALHAPTSSFSAQGLARSFAAAIESAFQANSQLYVVECQDQGRNTMHQDETQDSEMDNEDMEHNTENEPGESTDPWEQEVSILNVTARRFGSNSNERAWAGRTVKAKRIAARWFHFQKLEDQK